jgi:hypothetical protein
MDWRLYADRSRFVSVPQERLQGHIRRKDGRVYGHDWHVVMETSDFERAWAFWPRPGIVVTETEIRDDPILRELFDAWRAGDDTTYRQFAAAPLPGRRKTPVRGPDMTMA